MPICSTSRRVQIPHLLVFILMCGALLGSTGCRRKGVDVSGAPALKGRVTLDGELVKIGTVRAFGENNEASPEGTIAPDGTYLIPQIPLGKVILTVSPPPLMGRHNPSAKNPPDPRAKDPTLRKELEGKVLPRPGLPPDLPPPILELVKTFENVPEKYYLPGQSELTTDIKPGLNEYDIQLKSK